MIIVEFLIDFIIYTLAGDRLQVPQQGPICLTGSVLRNIIDHDSFVHLP